MDRTNWLNDLKKQGAHLERYGGLELAGHFADPAAEVRALLDDWAIYDQSHYGRLRLSGEDRVLFLHNLTSNNVQSLKSGQGHNTVVLNGKGRILDWGWVYATDEALLIVTQSGARESVLEHFEFYHFLEDIETDDRTDTSYLLAVSGPRAHEHVAKLLGSDVVDSMAPHDHKLVELDGRSVQLMRYDRFGQIGYRFSVEPADAGAVWRLFTGLGATPAGEEAIEQVRVAQGEPAFGRELTEERNPLEAGLKPVVSFSKGCYLGQEVIARLDTYKKVQRFLVHVRLGEDAAPHLTGQPKLLGQGKAMGWLTSWAPAPGADGFWALGYTLKRCHGSELHLEGGTPAQVVAMLTTAEGDGTEAE